MYTDDPVADAANHMDRQEAKAEVGAAMEAKVAREIAHAFTDLLQYATTLKSVCVPQVNSSGREIKVTLDEAVSSVLFDDAPLEAFHRLLQAPSEHYAFCALIDLREALAQRHIYHHAAEVADVRLGKV